MFPSFYVNRRTPVHALDPRTKILGMLMLSGLPFTFNDPRYVAVLAAGAVLVAAVGGCRENLVRLRGVYLLLFVVTFLTWQFYLPGTTVLARFGPAVITREGLLYGLAAGIRFVTVLTVSVVFLSCTRNEELTIGLIKLRLPYPAAFVISLTVRLVPTLVTAASTILDAQTARGFQVQTRNPVRRVAQVLPLAIPLVMYALRHASTMSLALEARGFSPTARRTFYANPVMTARDGAVLGTLALLLAVCLGLRLTGHGAVLPDRI